MERIKEFITSTAGKIILGIVALLIVVGIGMSVITVVSRTNDAKNIEQANQESVKQLNKKESAAMKTALEKQKREKEKKNKKQILKEKKLTAAANRNKANDSYAKVTGQAKSSHSTPQTMDISSSVYTNGSSIDRPATVTEINRFVGTDKYRKVINNYSSGTISIPSINVSLPIIEGTNNDHLWAGATTFRPDQNVLRGNFPLLSHNTGYKGMLFSDLGDVKKGDKIRVVSYSTGRKVEVNYKVTEVGIRKATETSLLADTDDRRLTLITCDVPHTTPNRTVVIAKPI